MKTKLFFLGCIVCLFFDVLKINAQTPIIGFISENTTWTKVNSPYVSLGNVVVKKNVTLSIEPGVEVEFDEGHKIIIEGTLLARGSAEETIRFTSKETTEPGAWGGILFENSSSDANFDGSGNYLNGSILQYCIVEFAGPGLKGDSASPFIDHCKISNNYGSGINIKSDSIISICNSTINKNTATYSYSQHYSYGIGIYISGGDDIILIDNNITENTYEGHRNPIGQYSGTAHGIGVYISDAENITVKHNTISDNTAKGQKVSGGGIAIFRSNTITFTNNVITENILKGESGYYRGASGAGIRIYEGENITMSQDTINNNTATGGDLRGGSYFDPGLKRCGGVLVSNAENLIFDNNITTDNQIGNMVIQEVSVSVIDNNNFTENESFDIWTRDCGFITIAKNNFNRNGGGAINTICDSMVITNNIFIGNNNWTISAYAWDSGSISKNTFTENLGTVIEVRHGEISISANTFTQNSGEYIIEYGVNGSNGSIVGNSITNNQGTYAVGIFNSSTIFNENAIFNNGTNYDIYYNQPNGSPDLDATNNYWGLTTESDIRTRVYDFFHNDQLAVVNILPFLTENPLTPVNDPEECNLPEAFSLFQNYPNPFNPNTEIRFELPKDSYVTLTIFNVLGQKIATLIENKQRAGIHRVSWNATDFPAGTYLYRLETKEFTKTLNMLLIK